MSKIRQNVLSLHIMSHTHSSTYNTACCKPPLQNDLNSSPRHQRPIFNRWFILLALGLCFISFTSCSTGRSARASIDRQLTEATNSWIGTPYRSGGTSRKGVDCSGFTMNIYREVYGIQLVHNSRSQLSTNCHKEVKKRKLKRGDLVFFATNGKRTRKRNINHVGIYLGDDRFVHASTKRGVIVSNLTEEYYRETWVTGGRVKK